MSQYNLNTFKKTLNARFSRLVSSAAPVSKCSKSNTTLKDPACSLGIALASFVNVDIASNNQISLSQNNLDNHVSFWRRCESCSFIAVWVSRKQNLHPCVALWQPNMLCKKPGNQRHERPN